MFFKKSKNEVANKTLNNIIKKYAKDKNLYQSIKSLFRLFPIKADHELSEQEQKTRLIKKLFNNLDKGNFHSALGVFINLYEIIHNDKINLVDKNQIILTKKLRTYFKHDHFSFVKANFAISKLHRFNITEDGSASISSANWAEDRLFKKAYNFAKSISVWGVDIRYRCYILSSLAKKSIDLQGDFIECGVDRGGTAMMVLKYLGLKAFKNRQFYLFDTFQGLDWDQLNDDELKNTNITDARYPNVLNDVKKSFDTFDFVRIIPGSVPSTLKKYKGNSVAFLHIDMNAFYPECEAFKFFWPLLSPGAPVIFDDYGFPDHHVQRDKLDKVAKSLGTKITMLPTCQGITWKS